MRRTVVSTVSVVAVLMVMGAAAFALVSQTSTTPKKDTPDAVQVAATGDSVKIQSSKGGSAILIADGMTPGQTREDTVKIKNTGTLPVTLSMGASGITSTPANASSIFQTKLFETGNASSPLYSGAVKDFSSAKVGDISPGQSKDFTLQAILPGSVGNEAENIKTSFNIDWKAVQKTTGPPPPECKFRRLRARFFVFRTRDRIRLVSRYQANDGGKVKTTFYWRKKKGKKFVRGKKIGFTVAKFKKTGKGKWGFFRVAKPQSVKKMRQFRKAKYGFMASLKPYKTASYCSKYLNVELTLLKRKYGNGQYTWFMRGSKFGFEK